MKTIPRSRRIAAIVALLTAVGVLAACAPTPAEPEISTLRVAVNPAWLPQNWDPVEGAATTYYFPSTQPVYESLITLNVETIQFDPILAESFKISDDRRTISFTLRDDVDFTDGEHLNAEAVEKNLTLAIPTRFSEYSPEIEVTGEYGVDITIDRAITTVFLRALATLPIASPVALDDLESLAVTPVGTGPYVLVDQVPDVSATFERNPDYRDPAAYPFDGLEVIAFEDDIAAANALKSGEVDATMLATNLAADVESAGFSIHSGGGTVMTLIWMDRDGSVQPALLDPRVRQAISYAFDREGIRDSIDLGYGVASSQPFAEGLPEYVEGGDDRYPFDLEKARELMADAGYADGFSVEIPTGQLDMSYNPIVEQTLADIGITVTYKQFPDYTEWALAMASGDYPLALYGKGDLSWVEDLRPGGYLSGYYGVDPAGVDPEIAEWLDTIANGDDAERAEASSELGEFLLEEAWYIPISRKLEVWGTVPEVSLEIGQVYYTIQLRNFGVAD